MDIRSQAFRQAFAQMVVIGMLVAVCTAMAAVGLPTIARPLFVLGGVAIAGYYIRRSPWEYLTATFWFWSISPFARRIIDMYGGFETINVVLMTPNIITLFMVPSILTDRNLLKRPESITGMLLFVPALYGLATSFVRGDLLPGAVAAADWFAPLLYYFYFITLAPHIGRIDASLRAFLPLNMLVIVGYGLFQYFSPPLWDVEWVVNSMMDSVGSPVPYGLRIFSTLNGPGVSAAWLSALTLLALHFRSRLSILLLPPTILVLALTLVRAYIGSTILGLLVVFLLGRGAALRSLLTAVAGVAVVLAIVAVLDHHVADSLSARFDTVTHLSDDNSALAREAVYRDGPALINAHPFGLGIGALGRGAVAANDGGFVDLDSGPIAIYLALGWVAGSIYFLGLLVLAAQTLLAARSSRSPAVLAMAALAITVVAVVAFVNIVGLQGVVFALACGYSAAAGICSRSRAYAFPAGMRQDLIHQSAQRI